MSPKPTKDQLKQLKDEDTIYIIEETQQKNKQKQDIKEKEVDKRKNKDRRQ
jgi:hypothetical protein